MAFGSGSIETAVAKWEVGPTKEVVEALMETLVDPRLPSRASVDDPPSEDAHKSVARQMHAVVLLYNYYHRKQKLELEFLDFVSFCKLALSLRPSLVSFMKMINGSKSVEFNGAEDQLSVTEKAIKDACDIAVSLDVTKDVPTTEGCPISKVAVLLIDSNKENCLLQFGAVTEGVWSLIEKEIKESSLNQEILAEENVCKKRKINNQQASTDFRKFLQLGYDAVKDVTGIDSADLMVLEAHIVYSLSKQKSAAQFYMMQCHQLFNINQRVPLKFLVESLQGPLAEKFCDSWTTTTLVEYHHLLPYVGFISDWLPRKDLCLPTLNGHNACSTKNSDGEELFRSRIPSSPLSKYNGENLNHIDNSSEMKISSSDEVANENTEDYQKKSKDSSGGKIASSINAFQTTKKHGNVIDEFRHRCDILNSTKESASRTKPEKVDNDREKHERGLLSGFSRGPSQSGVRDDDATQRMNMSTRTFSTIKERKKMNSSIRVYHQMKKKISSAKHDAHGPEEGVNSKVEKGDLLKSNDNLCRDKKIIAENHDVTILCNRSRVAATENAPAHFEASYNSEVENVLASEDLQNALALIDRKRQELYSKLCSMEDALASYEQNIERIRDGGEVGLARECIKSIISGNDKLLLKNEVQIQDHSNPQSKTKTRFSCTFFPGKSSCQDLEYICLKNNWRLPRYFVQPSDDKFMSNVVVQSKDFNLSSKGGSESSPCEARESAAAQMIAKIRDACMSTPDQS